MRRPRFGRRHLIAGAGLAALLAALVAPGAALAAPRERSAYQIVNHGTVGCGTFVADFTDYYDVRETDEFDADGNITSVLYHAEHHSDDVNSVTGFTIHGRKQSQVILGEQIWCDALS